MTLKYFPSQGYRSLCQALVNYNDRYKNKPHAYEIIITSGGLEVVLFAFMSCLNLGDEIIEQNVVLIDSVSKRYSECGIRIGALITKNEAVRKTVMKFCQARLSPPLIGQIVAEASIEGTEA